MELYEYALAKFNADCEAQEIDAIPMADLPNEVRDI